MRKKKESVKQLEFIPGNEPARIRFALSAPFRIWKACWVINHALGLSLALPSHPISISGLPNEEENDDFNPDTPPEELIYSCTSGWREYRLMTVKKAGLSTLKGFDFLLEIESDKKEGLPDTEFLLNSLKACNQFSAIINL